MELRRRERGAILIHVLIALLALTTVSALVIDYGVLWASRRQAQNAADAAAHAAAVALAYDGAPNLTDAGAPKLNAVAAAARNYVWGTPSGVTTDDVTFPTCPDGSSPCVRVNVFRDTAHGNALPAYFAKLAGVSNQSVRATATAEVLNGNASNCLKPWAIPDLWQENNGTPLSFDRYVLSGKGAGQLVANADVYRLPTDPNATGYNLSMIGTPVTMQTPKPPAGSVQQGWYQAVDVPRADGTPSGAKAFDENIASCNGQGISIGGYLPTETGAMAGPTFDGLTKLWDQDPYAYWDSTNKKIANSCAPTCAPISPRLVAVALFNPDKFQLSQATNSWTYCPTGGSCVQVVNILGFFITSKPDKKNNQVTGVLASDAGLLSGSNNLNGKNSFLKVVALVR